MIPEDRPQSAVVVGVDHTPASRVALEWAAHEAALRHIPLLVCHAYPHLGWPADREVDETNRVRAWRLVVEAARSAEVAERGLVAIGYADEGSPEQLLRSAVERPVMLAVGARGRGSLAAMLLGSAGVELAGHAACPVAVVRGGADPGPHLFAGHVVVGVEFPADRSRAAIGFAFAEAALRAVPVVAVHAGLLGPVDAWRDETFGEVHEERQLDGWDPLEAAVEPFRVEYPDVPVKLALRDAVPAVNGLLSAARGAAVLVVGGSGYGRVGGAVGGSVSRLAVLRASCPVIVVPATAAVPMVPAQEGGAR